VVKSEWVNGVARFRIPYLGRLRLALLGTGYSGVSDETITAGIGGSEVHTTGAGGGGKVHTTGAGGGGGVGIGSIAG